MAGEGNQMISTVNNVLKVRPCLMQEQLHEIAMKYFGLEINREKKLTENDSYDDRCFTVHGNLINRGDVEFDDPYSAYNKFVLKIFNLSQTEHISILEERYSKLANHSHPKNQQIPELPHSISLVNERNTFLGKCEIPLLKNAEFKNCDRTDLIKKGFLLEKDGVISAVHIVRLTLFIPGDIVDRDQLSDKLLHGWGAAAASMSKVIKNLSISPNTIDGFIWDIVGCTKEIKDPYIKSIRNDSERMVFEQIVSEFEKDALPVMRQELSMEWIHGDLTEHNLLKNDHHDIIGILDFDDCCYSYRVVELATAMTYMSIGCDVKEILKNLKKLFTGYSSIVQLNQTEVSVLYHIMLLRYVFSMSVGYYQYSLEPDNEYIMFNVKKAWKTFDFLVHIGKERFLKEVCS